MISDQVGVFDVVGLGVSTLDLLMVVEEFPDREIVFAAVDSTLQGGGPVANALVTLSRLGCRTAMIDQRGDDWRGERIFSDFVGEGVGTKWLSVCPETSSSIASILVRRKDGARAIVYSPGTCSEIHPDTISEEMVASAKIIHLNGRHWSASLKACKIALEKGVKISFDGGKHRYRPELSELIQKCNICIVSRQFAESHAQVCEIGPAAKALLETGPELVVITDGEAGSWVYSDHEEPFHQKAFVCEKVIDTTGAGDAYHGAFLYGILQDYSLKKSALFASAVAAMNTQGLGGRSALPALLQVEKFMQECLSTYKK